MRIFANKRDDHEDKTNLQCFKQWYTWPVLARNCLKMLQLEGGEEDTVTGYSGTDMCKNEINILAGDGKDRCDISIRSDGERICD